MFEAVYYWGSHGRLFQARVIRGEMVSVLEWLGDCWLVMPPYDLSWHTAWSFLNRDLDTYTSGIVRSFLNL